MLNRNIIDQEYNFLGERIHLFCCAVGVPPRRVQEALKSFYDEYFTLVYGLSPGYGPFRDETRKAAAQLLGCEAQEIAFSANTTEGLCSLATGYPLGPGDNVVVCDLENPSAMIPWVNASQNRGFQLRIVQTEGGRIEPEELFALADEHTKIICLSAVQYGTGFFADLKAIGSQCRSRGIVLAVDAIQAVGRIAIDVQAMCIDYLSCGGFKGLGAGFGVGLVYCSNALAPRIAPAYAGVCGVIGSVSSPQVYPPDPQLSFFSDARRLESGSHNTIGIVLLKASLDLILELGIEEIETHVLALEDYLRRGLAGTLLRFPGAAAPKNRSGLIVAYYPEGLYSQAAQLFDKAGLIMTHSPGYIRLALHCYNTMEQMDTIIGAFRALSNLIPTSACAGR